MGTTISFNGSTLWDEGTSGLGAPEREHGAFVEEEQPVVIPGAIGSGVKLVGGGSGQHVLQLQYIETTQGAYGTLFSTLQTLRTNATIGTLNDGSLITVQNCRLVNFTLTQMVPCIHSGSTKFTWVATLEFKQMKP